MKKSLTKWLIGILALAAVLIMALPQPSAAFICQKAYLSEDPNEPQPETAVGGFGTIWLEGEPNEPQPEIAIGCASATWLEGEPNEPQPECAGLIYLEDDPPELEPESC